jgi:hypothetical protein
VIGRSIFCCGPEQFEQLGVLLTLVDPTRAAPQIDENPFTILGLDVDATLEEVETAEAQWLNRLDHDPSVAARRYTTPLGIRMRTHANVRAAAAALRDVHTRCICELWARARETRR